MKTILESAGVRNAVVKSVGSGNPLGVIKATFDALKYLRVETLAGFPPEDLAAPVPTADQMQRMITSMTTGAAVPLPSHVLQAQRNAVARDALLREFGALTSADIGDMAASRSANRAALAHRWKSDGRIFVVQHQGTSYFPGFQFTESCQPLP